MTATRRSRKPGVTIRHGAYLVHNPCGFFTVYRGDRIEATTIQEAVSNHMAEKWCERMNERRP